MTTTSETAFTHSAEAVYDFVTNPANWTKTYPGSERIGKLPEVPLKVGDTWEEVITAPGRPVRSFRRPGAASAGTGSPAR